MANTTGQPLILKLYTSPVGKKLITGITGLGLAAFMVIHMAGNLLLLFVGRDAYNLYAFYLERLGPVFWTIELALLGVFLLHAATGVYIFINSRQARPVSYATYASRGKPSLQSLSSRTMILTGSVLGTFLVIHLLNFKFGPYYVTELSGREVRDIAQLVIEKFQYPSYVFSYIAVVTLLGFHLRHGLWSALQSIGLMGKAVRLLTYGISFGLAIAIAAGFLALPLAIYVGFLR